MFNIVKNRVAARLKFDLEYMSTGASCTLKGTGTCWNMLELYESMTLSDVFHACARARTSRTL